MIKVTHKNRLKMEMVKKIIELYEVRTNSEPQKKCYLCVSGTHKLNNCEIRNTIARYQWFDRTWNMYSHQQQAAHKGKKTVESD